MPARRSPAAAGVDGLAHHRLLADLVQGHQDEHALAADQAVTVGEARLAGLVHEGRVAELGAGRPA